MLKSAALALVMTTLLPAAALAQARAKKAEPARAPEYAATTHIDIDDADPVEGRLLTGDGDAVEAGPAKRWTSLIKLRTSFVPELISSAHSVR